MPKGLEMVGGRRIIDRVADALRPATTSLILAANDPAALDWLPGVAVVQDRFKGAGGLAGVHAALALGADIVAIAWDMPFVTTELVDALAGRSPGARAVVPNGVPPHDAEPFCAWYAPTIRDDLERFLESGGGAAHEFLSRAPGVRRLGSGAVAALGGAERLFFSVNTPDELARARAMADAQ